MITLRIADPKLACWLFTGAVVPNPERGAIRVMIGPRGSMFYWPIDPDAWRRK